MKLRKLLTVMAGTHYGPELVPNGGFEAELDGWVADESLVQTRATDQCTNGIGSYSFDLAVGTGQAFGHTTYDNFSLVAGKKYRFSMGYKNFDSSYVIGLIYSNAWNVLLTTGNLTPTANVWTNYTADFECLEAGGKLSLYVIGSPGQHARFDDISIRQIFP